MSPLISTNALANRLTDENLVIVDTRHDLANANFGRDAYAEAHVPGAIFMSIDDDLSAAKTGTNGRHPLPSPESFAKTLGEKGVGNDSTIIIYDQGTSMFVGRLWWMMKWLGHDEVYVLDGGFAQWQKEGRATESISQARNAALFTPNLREFMRVHATDTLHAITDPARRIVDARAPERYRGEVEPIDPIAGHIPGAVNRPFATNLRDGVFKSPEELRAELAVLLAGRAPENIIHQCGSGVSALSNMIAMEHAGFSGSKLYAGSWSEWCADPSRPVARN